MSAIEGQNPSAQAAFRTMSNSKREAGDLFEIFFKKYLMTDPMYADQLEDIWLWSEIPRRRCIAENFE